MTNSVLSWNYWWWNFVMTCVMMRFSKIWGRGKGTLVSPMWIPVVYDKFSVVIFVVVKLCMEGEKMWECIHFPKISCPIIHAPSEWVFLCILVKEKTVYMQSLFVNVTRLDQTILLILFPSHKRKIQFVWETGEVKLVVWLDVISSFVNSYIISFHM